ncbi:hypothetical protein, partial [Streptomyces broussonetiae]|uniref:hypothetical protein n=1 Tax=Streptomyces broussonetiae TaxID=2686304 RepID=UPI0035D82993
QPLHHAREAYTSALHVVGGVAAVVFTGLAVLALAMRPATRPTPAPRCASTRRAARSARSRRGRAPRASGPVITYTWLNSPD